MPGVLAFSIWGLVPIYFKLLDSVPSLEVLGHRVFWSVLLLLPLLKFTGQLSQLKTVFTNPKVLGLLMLSSILIAGNWLTFIWGVANDRILETSLGYFINPLLNIFLGYLFLSEKLSPLKMIAVGIAAFAVVLQIWLLGSIPWVAFAVAGTFGFYGLLRKHIPVAAATGLTVETILLLPATLGYFFWLYQTGDYSFSFDTPQLSLLLALAGLVTTVPLVLFNVAAKRLTLTSVGILQYLGPSISFLVGVFIFGEEVNQARIITFGLIWLALAIFTWDSYRTLKAKTSTQAAGS
nr:EamA family transporter RarD [Endozoicomonas sp. OPT23]